MRNHTPSAIALAPPEHLASKQSNRVLTGTICSKILLLANRHAGLLEMPNSLPVTMSICRKEYPGGEDLMAEYERALAAGELDESQQQSQQQNPGAAARASQQQYQPPPPNSSPASAPARQQDADAPAVQVQPQALARPSRDPRVQGNAAAAAAATAAAAQPPPPQPSPDGAGGDGAAAPLSDDEGGLELPDGSSPDAAAAGASQLPQLSESQWLGGDTEQQAATHDGAPLPFVPFTQVSQSAKPNLFHPCKRPYHLSRYCYFTSWTIVGGLYSVAMCSWCRPRSPAEPETAYTASRCRPPGTRRPPAAEAVRPVRRSSRLQRSRRRKTLRQNGARTLRMQEGSRGYSSGSASRAVHWRRSNPEGRRRRPHARRHSSLHPSSSLLHWRRLQHPLLQGSSSHQRRHSSRRPRHRRSRCSSSLRWPHQHQHRRQCSRSRRARAARQGSQQWLHLQRPCPPRAPRLPSVLSSRIAATLRHQRCRQLSRDRQRRPARRARRLPQSRGRLLLRPRSSRLRRRRPLGQP